MYKMLWEEAKLHHGSLAHLRTIQGRRKYHESEEDPLAMPSEFVSDEAKILSSKAFRLLERKTQVLTNPINPLIRNRRTHVMEVVADSIVISDILGLNTDLVRAIALGHDMGHIPFGHPGESFLAERMGRKNFCHEVMGPLIAQKIERRGKNNGLNLTFETLDGMMRHSGSTAREGMTQEAWVVRYADKFAYIFADYNDVTRRMGYPVSRELQLLMNEFGASQRERTTTAIAGIVVESAERGKVSFEHTELAAKFSELRSQMMKIYIHLTQQDLNRMMEPVLSFLKEVGIGDPFLMFSLLTDHDVIFLANQHSKNVTHLKETGISELLPYLDEIGEIDLCNPYLDW